MQLIFFLLILLILPVSLFAGSDQAVSGQLQHVIFQGERLFFITKQERSFGIMLIENRQILSQYKLELEQRIIKVDKFEKKVILRKDRTKVLIFKLRTLDISELNIEIAFKHQKIIDLIENQQKIFVMTEKDVRMYSRNEQVMEDHPKNIIASGKKRQIFRKIFQSSINGQQFLSLFLTRDQEICVRQIFFNKPHEQNCFFNISSELKQIQKVGEHFLIQTNNLNYVIKQDQTVYSFKAEITQTDTRFAIIGSQFKTFDIQRQISLQGMAVIGSDADNLFWLKYREGELVLYCNQKVILTLEKQVVKRSWIGKNQATGVYNLLLQLEQNSLILHQIQPQTWSYGVKWTYGQSKEIVDEEL